MNFEKLFKAASLIRNTEPLLSEELIKIAQELSTSVNTGTEQNLNLNPNIKNFASPSTQTPEKKVHKVTFTVAVPPEWGELEIMNTLLPTLKQMDDSNQELELKGYQFTQS